MIFSMSVDKRSDLTCWWLLWTASTCRIVAGNSDTTGGVGWTFGFLEGFGIVDVNRRESYKCCMYLYIPMHLVQGLGIRLLIQENQDKLGCP